MGRVLNTNTDPVIETAVFPTLAILRSQTTDRAPCVGMLSIPEGWSPSPAVGLLHQVIDMISVCTVLLT